MLLSGGESISKILAFVAFAYLARLLGPDTYGDIEFALAVTLSFNLIVEGGLGLLGAREVAKDDKSVLNLTFHIVILRFLLAMGAFLLLVLFVSISNNSWQEKQLVLLYGLTLFETPGLLQWVFQAFDQMKWVAIASVIRWSIFAGFVFLFIFEPGQVWVIPLIEIGALGCVVAFNFGVFSHLYGHFWQRFDTTLALSLLRQTFPIGVTQLMWGFKVYLPIIMLGLLVGGQEVGWFGAAHRIVIALHTFVWMYFFNIYPSISRCSQQPPAALQHLIGKSLQVTSWSAVFIAVTGIILGKPLITLVYGSQYGEGIIVFQILIWLVAFTLISSHYMYILIAYNRQWIELLTAVCGAAVSIILNLLLIPNYGLLGAAYALLATEATIWGLNYYIVRRQIAPIPFWNHLTKPIIAGTFMALLILILPQANLVTLALSATLLYGLGMFILQPTLINDIRVLLVKEG